MNKELDDSFLSCLKPTATSTAERKKHGVNMDNSLNVSNLEESLGILSIKSHDLTNHANLSDYLHQSRSLARHSLQRQSTLNDLPSRYLKPSSNESILCDSYAHESTGSTINESDLLKSASKLTPSNTSTPRTSVAEEQQQSRYSLGQFMTSFTQKIMNSNVSLDNVVSEFKHEMNNYGKSEIDSAMFTPAEEAESKLLADELSWKRERGVPGQTSEVFSMYDTSDSLPTSSVKMSMGEFFKQKTEDLENLHLAKSPIKKQKPQRLIDDSITFSEHFSSTLNEENINNDLEMHNNVLKDISNTESSLSVSTIAKMLSQTVQTPNKLLNYFYAQDVNSKNNTILKENSDNPNRSSELPQPTQTSPILKSNGQDKIVSEVISKHSTVISEENPSNSNVNRNSRSSDLLLLGQRSAIFNSTKPEPDYSRDSRKLSTGDRSVSSVHTTGSLSSLVGGRLPIEATRCEIIWGCVRAGKSSPQEIIIRNKSQSRLRFLCTISEPCFKLLSRERLEVEYVGSVKYLLQPGESKTITVLFAPSKIGAAKGFIGFTSVDQNLQQSKPQKILLFGYGGHGIIELYNLTKDTTGRFWLSLGYIEHKARISQKFTVQNNGSLPSFAVFAFESKEISCFRNVNVSPSCIVLQPHEKEEVVVTYVVSKEDLKLIQSVCNRSVVEMGVLTVITSTEAIRGRIRKLSEASIKKGLDVPPICKIITNKFPKESIPSDLDMLTESSYNLRDLLPELTRKEIVLTLEQDPNKTLLPQFSDDETLFFQTICQDTTIIHNELIKDCIKLEPKCVILTPPHKVEDMFLLTSEYSQSVEFKIQEVMGDVELSPESGILDAGNTVIVKVKCKQNVARNSNLKVFVIIENEIFESDVKILFIKTAS